MKQFTDAEIQQQREENEAFHAKYPDCPRSEDIECLNLVMKKEYAEQIARGEKTVEYRAYSKHYRSRMYDKAVGEYMEAHADDEQLIEQVLDFEPVLRQVKKIRFHNYNNTWHLDVECVANDVCVATREDGEYIRDEYGNSELLEEALELEKNKVKDLPVFFFYVLGEILDNGL